MALCRWLPAPLQPARRPACAAACCLPAATRACPAAAGRFGPLVFVLAAAARLRAFSAAGAACCRRIRPTRRAATAELPAYHLRASAATGDGARVDASVFAGVGWACARRVFMALACDQPPTCRAGARHGAAAAWPPSRGALDLPPPRLPPVRRVDAAFRLIALAVQRRPALPFSTAGGIPLFLPARALAAPRPPSSSPTRTGQEDRACSLLAVVALLLSSSCCPCA